MNSKCCFVAGRVFNRFRGNGGSPFRRFETPKAAFLHKENLQRTCCKNKKLFRQYKRGQELVLPKKFFSGNLF
jgi:hypothetical protein